ncbi:MAG TPA: aminotransferase class I/II-fold pyridoxal phosphate-dependent enzyme [Candidatus Eisenbacteria bacterium]|nr:aminotransferase class I/II-fold pyridoxal phosphate-dependent enzyme [Candidatus Eisenbacteria bacterium]
MAVLPSGIFHTRRGARRASARDLDYGPPEGAPSLREAIADYLHRARAVVCDAARVVIVNGSQQTLDLTARVLLDRGDRVLLEEMHYAGARSVFLAAGARIVTAPVDGDGLDVAALGERHVRRSRARNAARRAVLLDAVAKHLGDRVEVAGVNAGIHALLWVRRLPAKKLPALVRRAEAAGVGVFPITPHCAKPPDRAGLLLGYASLTDAAIRDRIRRLAIALDDVSA